MDRHYSIPKPTHPTALFLLGAAVVLGLIGLGLVAFAVFRLVDDWPIAAAFALVIEFGMISEAVSIIRKNRPAILGLIISILVSGSYNFTRVNQTAAGQGMALWEILALAIGPLSAVFFLALSLGAELREHEARVARWEKTRQAWLDEQTRLAMQASADEEQRRATAALNVERLRLEADRQRAADAQQAQLAQTQMQIEEQRRAERAAARRAARADRASRADAVQPAQNGSAIAQPVAQRGTYQQFELAQHARNGAGPMQYQEVMDAFNVSRRTAYNWLALYQSQKPEDDHAV